MWSVFLRAARALVRIPHDDVGVGADARCVPFLRIQAEDLRRRGRRDLDEAVHRDLALRARLPRAGAGASRRPACRSGSSRSRRGRAPSGPSCRTGSDRSRRPGGRSCAGRATGDRGGASGAAAACTRTRRPSNSSPGSPRRSSSREEQVLRAGLGVRRQAAVARFHHALERALRREVHHVHRHLRHLGERDRALGAGRLGDLGAGQRVIDRRGVALRRARAATSTSIGRPDLGVHADQRAELAGAQHAAEDLLVVDEEHARIGHEHLERR